MDCAQGGLGGTFISCAARGEKIWDRDRGDDADDRNDDEKFYQREALLAVFSSHFLFILLERMVD